MGDDYDPIADVWKSVDVAHDALRTGILGPDAAKPRQAFTYVRDELDFYSEQSWTVDLLISAEKYSGKVLDPCCGNGTIGRTFEKRRHPIRSTDYAVRPYGECGLDFLDPATDYGRIDHIVCNPPFRHTEAFIVRALGIVRKSAAFLVPLKWLASQTRYDFFETYGRPARVYVLSNRVSMPPGEFLDPETGLFAVDDPKGKWKAGDTPSGGAIDYCWVVFVPGYGGPTDMRWLSKGGVARPYAGKPRCWRDPMTDEIKMTWQSRHDQVRARKEAFEALPVGVQAAFSALYREMLFAGARRKHVEAVRSALLEQYLSGWSE